MKKLAVARFWFQGNAFSPLPTTLESFQLMQWQEGDEALAGARGTQTELAAVSDFADSNPDWEVTALRCASALPAGPVDEALFNRILSEVCVPFAKHKWDAVYLSLHGAAITTERTSADYELLRAVRLEVAPVRALYRYVQILRSLPVDSAIVASIRRPLQPGQVNTAGSRSRSTIT